MNSNVFTAPYPSENFVKTIVAPHLEEQAIEQYIGSALGMTQTLLIRATRTVLYHERLYVLIRRSDGEPLAVYREGSGGQLNLIDHLPLPLLEWARHDPITAYPRLSG